MFISHHFEWGRYAEWGPEYLQSPIVKVHIELHPFVLSLSKILTKAMHYTYTITLTF